MAYMCSSFHKDTLRLWCGMSVLVRIRHGWLHYLYHWVIMLLATIILVVAIVLTSSAQIWNVHRYTLNTSMHPAFVYMIKCDNHFVNSMCCFHLAKHVKSVSHLLCFMKHDPLNWLLCWHFLNQVVIIEINLQSILTDFALYYRNHYSFNTCTGPVPTQTSLIMFWSFPTNWIIICLHTHLIGLEDLCVVIRPSFTVKNLQFPHHICLHT